MFPPIVTGRRAVGAVVLTALLAGCQSPGADTGTPDATATATAPATVPPAPSPSSASPSPFTAANTVAVCQAVDRLIIATSKEIAADSAKATERELTAEQIAEELRADLAELADQVRAEAGRAEDPRIEALVADTADRIDAGSRAKRPTTWMADTYTRIPTTLMRDCRP
ncbi:hypothetical protein ACFOOK_23950 [Micromonospora krabiensis]|uniref:Uncharacterized protein n=1 Tax=Micromonospora krabiensis TaxID=307121 RepID=A0A1C3N712_9ACTN|nr:hypothetical protein [Micromonospora krabiensis]SBV28379.1 hypothetical protein GA0070620_3922 [Micromonospora krabiensis]